MLAGPPTPATTPEVPPFGRLVVDPPVLVPELSEPERDTAFDPVLVLDELAVRPLERSEGGGGGGDDSRVRLLDPPEELEPPELDPAELEPEELDPEELDPLDPEEPALDDEPPGSRGTAVPADVEPGPPLRCGVLPNAIVGVASDSATMLSITRGNRPMARSSRG